MKKRTSLRSVLRPINTMPTNQPLKKSWRRLKFRNRSLTFAFLPEEDLTSKVQAMKRKIFITIAILAVAWIGYRAYRIATTRSHSPKETVAFNNNGLDI